MAAGHTGQDGKVEAARADRYGTNRLAQANSPYLLQHAHNPVDWYPWGDEARERARAETKPIFLSIGYSACHWCHVMERESFENETIAALLNRWFVAIKVDREERPDIDAVYMQAVQAMTGSGGWPLSVFLTPDLKPFFGGTYFPPDDRYGRPGFERVLVRISELWRDQRQDLEKQAAALSESLAAENSFRTSPGENNGDFMRGAVAELRAQFDAEWGGFGGAPKFPPAAGLNLLIRSAYQTDDAPSMQMLLTTLDKMAAGGLYDQLGGGFHRYSVDRFWLVPHFEKMLYDNALLARTYTDAWLVTGREDYSRVARETLDYVLRDLRDDSGAFHASEDADSEGEEGRFYVWSREEIQTVLGPVDGELFCAFYDVSRDGNFEGQNILHVPEPLGSFAAARGEDAGRLRERLRVMRARLLMDRSRRIRPGRDDKVLVAWNGLMISAFARAFEVFGEARYRQAAEAAAEHILSEMLGDELLHTYRAGISSVPGFLEDYAALINALIDLHEATLQPHWLARAHTLTDQMIARFWDGEGHGFFQTSKLHDRLPTRPKPIYDGSVPSGNALAVLACARMGRFTGDPQYGQRAAETIEAYGRLLSEHPSAVYGLLAAAEFQHAPPVEVVLSGDAASAETRALAAAVWRVFDPDRIVSARLPGESEIYAWPLFAGREPDGAGPKLYVCENFTCRKPMTQADRVGNVLSGMSKRVPRSRTRNSEKTEGMDQE